LNWSACEKAILPEPTQEGIPFGMKGEFNGNSFQLSLDDPGYKMVTDHFFNDTIWIFSGHLKPASASQSILPEMEIYFRNLDFGVDSNIQEDRIKNTTWQWFDETKTKLFHPLHVRVATPDSSTNWTLQLQNRWNLTNQREFNILWPEREPIKAQLRYDSQKGRGTIGFTVKPENNQPQKLPVANWSVQQMDSILPRATLHARLHDNGPNPNLHYLWGGGDTSQVISVSGPGIYSVSITDHSGKQFWHAKTLNWLPQTREFVDPMKEVELFSHWAAPIIEKDRFQPGSIRIRLKDRSGKWYTSNTPQQNSKIEIIDVKPYKVNDLGQRTVAIKISISCKMKAENKNEWAILNNFTGWLAVAIP
jgi:hypothetical protein